MYVSVIKEHYRYLGLSNHFGAAHPAPVQPGRVWASECCAGIISLQKLIHSQRVWALRSRESTIHYIDFEGTTCNSLVKG